MYSLKEYNIEYTLCITIQMKSTLLFNNLCLPLYMSKILQRI